MNINEDIYSAIRQDPELAAEILKRAMARNSGHVWQMHPNACECCQGERYTCDRCHGTANFWDLNAAATYCKGPPELTATDQALLYAIEDTLRSDGGQVITMYSPGEEPFRSLGAVVLFPSSTKSILQGLQEMQQQLTSVVRQMEHICGVESGESPPT